MDVRIWVELKNHVLDRGKSHLWVFVDIEKAGVEGEANVDRRMLGGEYTTILRFRKRKTGNSRLV